LTPIYPACEAWTQGRLRLLIERALQTLCREELPELLPMSLLQRLGLPELRAALEFLHRPPAGTAPSLLAEGRHPAQRRLAFEELLAYQLSLLELRRLARSEFAAPLDDPAGLEARLLGELPFRLTGAQRRVLAEVDRDLRLRTPMARLRARSAAVHKSPLWPRRSCSPSSMPARSPAGSSRSALRSAC
jgi:ATP-dependent DNA helicase RecG